MFIIRKIDDKNIGIFDTSIMNKELVVAAKFAAKTQNDKVVLESSELRIKYTFGFDECTVDEESFTSSADAVKALNAFIGAFKSGGGTGGGVSPTAHNNLTERSAEDCHPISSITGLEGELALRIKDVEDTGSGESIVQVVAGQSDEDMFSFIGYSSDGETYVSGGGVWKLSADDKPVATNLTSGRIHSMGESADGTLYFGIGTEKGIFKRDIATGNIIPTNLDFGDIISMVLSNSGKFYAVGEELGTYLLDDITGDFTLVFPGITGGAAKSADGTLYFMYGGEIFRLDDVTGQLTTIFTNNDLRINRSLLSSDGTLYFLGTYRDSEGFILYKLDENGDIVQVFSADLEIANFNESGDGTLYFLSFDTLRFLGVISKLENEQLVSVYEAEPYTILEGMGKSSDGTLYFGGYALDFEAEQLVGAGILKLDADGQIVQTNNTDAMIQNIGQSADGTLFFLGDGIYRLEFIEKIFGRSKDKWIDLNKFIDDKINKALALQNQIHFVTEVPETGTDGELYIIIPA
jgi:hypothetical protein